MFFIHESWVVFFVFSQWLFVRDPYTDSRYQLSESYGILTMLMLKHATSVSTIPRGTIYQHDTSTITQFSQFNVQKFFDEADYDQEKYGRGRLWQIEPFEICIILQIIQKPNPIIVLFLNIIVIRWIGPFPVILSFEFPKC